MSETAGDLLASLATQPWRPQSLRPPRAPSMRLYWRLGLLVGIVLLHVFAARFILSVLSASGTSAPEQTVLVLNFPMPAASPQVAEPIRISGHADANAPAKRRRKAPAHEASSPAEPRAERTQPTLPATPIRSKPGSLSLYTDDGRLRVPDNMLEEIDRSVGDQRVFSYQVPHLDDAHKYFDRKQVVAYEPTRFDQYWQPDQAALPALLAKLVEKTTREVRIPMPGRPDSALVCQISLLALGGGCRLLTNGEDYVGPLDDPDTLSKEEDRQCQAWWQQIIGARTQDVWRKTRSLYEAQCRKPLARQP